jgi:HemY protein
LQNAEVWLNARPNDAQLLLALGRISLRNQQWGKARKYFEASLREQAGTEAFAELARLLHSLKEQEHSPQFLQEETRLISLALPDFPQPREAQ